MRRENPAPPTPVVEHLPTIFRRIRIGEYRVPPFQRDFVWEERQVLELLESVYRGYPIGSILLWRVEKRVFQSVKQSMVGFPSSEERYPVSFVLDGVQRLSALNGVFNQDEVVHDRRFDVWFDLEGETFVHGRDLDRVKHPIPLKAVFHPRAFLGEQKRLASMPDSDLLLERAIRLLAVFQEYMVPVVSISERSATEVVSIFQRINSTGVRLGVVDFMRALTWSDQFDLTKELDDTQNSFEEQGFSFEDETLLKALGIIFDLRPLPDVLLDLRDRDANELHRGVQVLRNNLAHVTRFVSSTLGMASADALPYEAQWLLLVRLVKEGVNLFEEKGELLYWITQTSFHEALKGRPDHALARMIEDLAQQALSGLSLQLPPISLMGVEEFITKRFLRGKATSVAYVQGLIRRGAFNTPVSAVPYELFAPIVGRDDLSRASFRELRSAKTIGNVVYWPYTTSETFADIVARYEQIPDDLLAFLEPQFIDRTFLQHLRNGDVARALSWRATEVLQFMGAEPLLEPLGGRR